MKGNESIMNICHQKSTHLCAFVPKKRPVGDDALQKNAMTQGAVRSQSTKANHDLLLRSSNSVL